MEVYTDGCCNSNGSAWCVVVPSLKLILRRDFPGATNQQAELGAVIQAVHKFGPNLIIKTDSAYAIGCFTQWYPNWLRNGWKNAKNKPVENKNFIEMGLKLGANQCRYEHVKAHVGILYNEMADYYCKNKILNPIHQGWNLI